MVRLALKVAYDGTRFSGSQVQPDARTVHGELAAALRELGLAHERILWAGRTDAGVSAAGNVAVVDGLAPDEKLLPTLTFHMEDAWVWAQAPVGDGFEPRHARRRRYRYHLATPLDSALIEDALLLFVGTHDFSRFARLEPGVNPVRTVERVEARRVGPLVIIEVVGESFLWNQVRRMVAAAEAVASGKVGAQQVAAALDKGAPGDFGVARPEPLVLVDVEHPDVAWRGASEDVRRRLFSRLGDRVLALQRETAVLSDLLREAR